MVSVPRCVEALGRPLAAAARLLQRFRRCERAAVGFLFLFVFYAAAALLGLVANIGNATRQRVEAQNVVDAAAHAAATHTARGLNLIANCNVAVLELTAFVAMADAFEPTYQKSMEQLDWYRPLTALPYVGAKWAAEIAREEIALQTFRAIGVGFGALRPTVDSTRHAVGEVSAGIVAALPALPITAAVGSGRTNGPEVRLIPLYVPRLPIERQRIEYYRDTGLRILRRMDAATFLLLIPAAPLSLAAYKWRRQTRREFDALAGEDEPPVFAFDVPAEAWNCEQIDRCCRHPWLGRRSGPRWEMSWWFGDAGQAQIAVAEALVYNPERWDLLTARWRATLVPVQAPAASFGLPLHH